ncbi:DUF5988 family protein [Micromonospora sp. WMMD1128]|uniref:DUF5988 family protein n=1 Tax=unclassified Micromonospora TaxID=2617518 RepID=UPI00248C46EF|nr:MULTISPECIES: DUF5988 family protein [unclassified Micromonospora]WBB71292.1 DUF5988 family protein [Micromonospora sp. WMMD1128]WFE35238.1 DUF5988 family protein [Micromonospora sp. WMMD975]
MTDVRYEECRLEGGPGYLPDNLRNPQVLMAENKVKVPFYNAWEHFERMDEFTETGLPIFRWTMQTRAAE